MCSYCHIKKYKFLGPVGGIFNSCLKNCDTKLSSKYLPLYSWTHALPRKDAQCNKLWWMQRLMDAQGTRVSVTWVLNPNQDTHTNPLKLRQYGKGMEGVQESEDEKNSWKCSIVGMTQPLQPWSVSQHLNLPAQDWVPHQHSKGQRGTQQDHTPFCWTISYW